VGRSRIHKYYLCNCKWNSSFLLKLEIIVNTIRLNLHTHTHTHTRTIISPYKEAMSYAIKCVDALNAINESKARGLIKFIINSDVKAIS